MPPSGPPNEQEIMKIARRTTDIIESNITPHVCLFGSAASYLWAGIGRIPNVRCCHSLHLSIPLSTEQGGWSSQDVDIVVSGGFNPEDIKEEITQADDRYYLEPSRKPGATHQILYCRLPGWTTDGRCVKVDILVPPTLNIPEISSSERDHIDYIPVMPIFDLLVMKTQGWWHHRNSPRADQRDKEDDDVSDIVALLQSAKQENVSYADEANEDRHSRKFMKYARTLANRFVRDKGRRRQWKALGFPV